MPRRTKIPEKIISILVENPIITRGELYKRLGVSYQAMQKHLHALQESGIVKQSFVVDEDKIKINKYQFWILILTKHDSLASKIAEEATYVDDYQRRLCREIAASFEQDSELVDGLIYGGTHILIGGDYDIILRLFADNPDSVGRYVTRFLRSNSAVSVTRTAWSLTNGKPEEVEKIAKDVTTPPKTKKVIKR